MNLTKFSWSNCIAAKFTCGQLIVLLCGNKKHKGGEKMKRNENALAVNIPADGLFLAIEHNAGGDLSRENSVRIIKEYVDKYLDAKPDIVLLNVCYRRALTPSEVFDSFLYNIETDDDGFAVRGPDGKTKKTPNCTSSCVSKYFVTFFACASVLLKNGVDIYAVLTEYIREKGCKVFLSLRMNDGHHPNDPAINSSFALKDGSKHTILHDGVQLDYSQKAVQNYFYQYIKELLENYTFDGIELDWLRFPTLLPKEKRGDLEILNGYMRSVRALIDSYNKDISLAVRVLPDPKEVLGNGTDVCRWIADGCVDMVTIENFYTPANFEMPVAQWRKNIAEKNTANNAYKLFCGTDWGISCVYKYSIAMNPALVRGFASECLSRGADGVYLFNFFEENGTSSFEFVADGEKAYLKNCFAERIKAAKEGDGLPRRTVHMGLSNDRYPILLPPCESYEFSYTPKKPFGLCKIVVGCDADGAVSVDIDGRSLSGRREKVYDGFGYVPENEIGTKGEFIYAISQAAPHVFAFAVPDGVVSSKEMRISIKNVSAETAKILWIEIENI